MGRLSEEKGVRELAEAADGLPLVVEVFNKQNAVVRVADERVGEAQGDTEDEDEEAIEDELVEDTPVDAEPAEAGAVAAPEPAP